MMGMTVDEPTFVFGDNQSVLTNTTAPASTLKKKSNAIAYHFVRAYITIPMFPNCVYGFITKF